MMMKTGRIMAAAVLVVTSTMFAGCGGCGEEELEPVELECEIRGFPCSLAEVDDEVLEESRDLGEEALDMLLDGADREEVVDHLADHDQMADVRAGRHSTAFRLEEGRRIWVVHPDSPMATPPTQPPPVVNDTRLQGANYDLSSTDSTAQPLRTSDEQDVVHRPGADRQEKRALLLAPYFYERNLKDSAYIAWEHLRVTPGYRGGIAFRPQLDVSDLTGWGDYDLVHLSTHGDTLCIDDDDVATQRLGAGDQEPQGALDNCASFLQLGIDVPRSEPDIDYGWDVVDRPDDSELDLDGETDPTVTFTPDVPGNYTVEFHIDNPSCVLGDDAGDELTEPITTSFTVRKDYQRESPDEIDVTDPASLVFNLGDPVRVIGDDPPKQPGSEEEARIYEQAGLDLVVMPGGLRSTAATEDPDACGIESPCRYAWVVGASTEFFARQYGPDNPLENTFLHFDSCKTMFTDPRADDFAERVWGPSTSFLGWDDVSATSQTAVANRHLYTELRRGLTISDALQQVEEMGESSQEIDCGGAGTIHSEMKAALDRDHRIREIVVPHELESSQPIRRVHPFQTIFAPDPEASDSDDLEMSVHVEGIDTDDDLSQYKLDVFVDGESVPESWTLEEPWARQEDDNTLVVDLETPLGRSYEDLPDPVNVTVRLELPTGDGYSEFEFEATDDATCTWGAEVSGAINESWEGGVATYQPNSDGGMVVQLQKIPSGFGSEDVPYILLTNTPEHTSGTVLSTDVSAQGDVQQDGYVNDEETFETRPLEFEILAESDGEIIGMARGPFGHWAEDGAFASMITADIWFHAVPQEDMEQCQTEAVVDEIF